MPRPMTTTPARTVRTDPSACVPGAGSAAPTALTTMPVISVLRVPERWIGRSPRKSPAVIDRAGPRNASPVSRALKPRMSWKYRVRKYGTACIVSPRRGRPRPLR
ncbi:hypothetical protein [Streptosporangium sp. V21-05]|uniref:hypothetical protein n=1 Tax=Streptosporangium sp. V21-05 TaxID=3446115 RepID=UPI003F52B691